MRFLAENDIYIRTGTDTCPGVPALPSIKGVGDSPASSIIVVSLGPDCRGLRGVIGMMGFGRVEGGGTEPSIVDPAS